MLILRHEGGGGADRSGRQVLIISYETFRIHVDRLKINGPELIICDEAHRFSLSPPYSLRRRGCSLSDHAIMSCYELFRRRGCSLSGAPIVGRSALCMHGHVIITHWLCSIHTHEYAIAVHTVRSIRVQAQAVIIPAEYTPCTGLKRQNEPHTEHSD